MRSDDKGAGNKKFGKGLTGLRFESMQKECVFLQPLVETLLVGVVALHQQQAKPKLSRPVLGCWLLASLASQTSRSFSLGACRWPARRAYAASPGPDQRLKPRNDDTHKISVPV